MLHFIIERIQRWEMDASSFSEAKKMFKARPDEYEAQSEPYNIVCEDNGDEEQFG